MRIGVTNLAAKFTVEGNLTEDLVQFILRSGGLSQLTFRIAIETSGVGTRIALPVSLPSNWGSALETARAAPVSVITMFSTAERPRTITLVEVIDQVLVIRESVHGLHVTAFHTVHIVKNLQCGVIALVVQGCRRKNLIVVR